MTDAERADLRRLMGDKAFLAFLYRTIRSAGLFSVASTAPDARSLDYVEGRRSLAIEMLHEIEELQPEKSPDGLPVLTSIQIFLSAAQSTAKENPLGRRNDPYRDLSPDDGGSTG